MHNCDGDVPGIPGWWSTLALCHQEEIEASGGSKTLGEGETHFGEKVGQAQLVGVRYNCKF